MEQKYKIYRDCNIQYNYAGLWSLKICELVKDNDKKSVDFNKFYQLVI